MQVHILSIGFWGGALPLISRCYSLGVLSISRPHVSVSHFEFRGRVGGVSWDAAWKIDLSGDAVERQRRSNYLI